MSIEQLAVRIDAEADELRQASAALGRLRALPQPAPGRLAATADRMVGQLEAALDARQAEAGQLSAALALHAAAIRRAVAELADIDPEVSAGHRSLEV
jgi:hypothetical protein